MLCRSSVSQSCSRRTSALSFISHKILQIIDSVKPVISVISHPDPLLWHKLGLKSHFLQLKNSKCFCVVKLWSVFYEGWETLLWYCWICTLKHVLFWTQTAAGSGETTASGSNPNQNQIQNQNQNTAESHEMKPLLNEDQDTSRTGSQLDSVVSQT